MKWARLTKDHKFLQTMRALYIPSLWLKSVTLKLAVKNGYCKTSELLSC